jgi:uncharacterized Fe-S cluster protein YjdI
MAKKEYTNGEVTIVWEAEKCIHSANCVKGLPGVFDSNKRPWINAEGATTQEMVDQIKKCPSGALSYFMNEAENQEAQHLETVVEVLENGPLIIYGTLQVTHPDGKQETKNKTTAFCRCGHSNNKPYCDGAHRKVDFQG